MCLLAAELARPPEQNRRLRLQGRRFLRQPSAAAAAALLLEARAAYIKSAQSELTVR